MVDTTATKIESLLQKIPNYLIWNKNIARKAISGLVQVCYVSKTNLLTIYGQPDEIPMEQWEEWVKSIGLGGGGVLRDLVEICVRYKNSKGAGKPLTEKGLKRMSIESEQEVENIVELRVNSISNPTAKSALLKAIRDKKIFRNPRADRAQINGKDITDAQYEEIGLELFNNDTSKMRDKIKAFIVENSLTPSEAKKEKKAEFKERYAEGTADLSERFIKWVSKFLRVEGKVSIAIYMLINVGGHDCDVSDCIVHRIYNPRKLSDVEDTLLLYIRGGLQIPNTNARVTENYFKENDRIYLEFDKEYRKLTEGVEGETPTATKFFFDEICKAIRDMRIPKLGEIPTCAWFGTAYHLFDFDAYMSCKSRNVDELIERCPTWMKWLKNVICGHTPMNDMYTSTEAFCCWVYMLLQKPELMRQGFMVRGPGLSGNTTISATLLHIFGVAGTDFVHLTKRTNFTGSKYENKAFATYSEIAEQRVLGNTEVKMILGGDTQTIERKNENAYDGKIHMVLFITGNNKFRINTFDRSEMSRCLIMESKPLRKEDVDEQAGEKCIKEFYYFYAYCERVYRKHIVDGRVHLPIPVDMMAYIEGECSTYGAKVVRDLTKWIIEAGEYDGDWMDTEAFANKILSWTRIPGEEFTEQKQKKREIFQAIDHMYKSGVCDIEVKKLSSGVVLFYVPIKFPTYNRGIYKEKDIAEML